jgi:hypothetical protein
VRSIIRGLGNLLHSGTWSFPGLTWPKRGVNHPPDLVTWLKEEYSYTSRSRLQLYIYSSSGSPWPVVRRALPILL